MSTEATYLLKVALCNSFSFYYLCINITVCNKYYIFDSTTLQQQLTTKYTFRLNKWMIIVVCEKILFMASLCCNDIAMEKIL